MHQKRLYTWSPRRFEVLAASLFIKVSFVDLREVLTQCIYIGCREAKTDDDNNNQKATTMHDSPRIYCKESK